MIFLKSKFPFLSPFVLLFLLGYPLISGNPLSGNTEGSKPGKADSNRTQSGFPLKKRPLGDEQIALLHSLLNASPERLKIIRKTIERVESMTLEERKNMRGRLKRFRDTSPHARSKMLKDFRVRQDFLGKHWQTLDSASRAKEIKRFHELPFPERKKYLEKISRKKRGGDGNRSKSKDASRDY